MSAALFFAAPLIAQSADLASASGARVSSIQPGQLPIGPAAPGAGHVVDFPAGTGARANNAAQTVGWNFNVTAPIVVLAMSWYDDGQNGLSIPHEAGIWDPAGTLIATTRG